MERCLKLVEKPVERSAGLLCLKGKSLEECCDRLKKTLRNTMLSNPDIEPEEDNEFFETIINAEVVEEE